MLEGEYGRGGRRDAGTEHRCNQCIFSLCHLYQTVTLHTRQWKHGVERGGSSVKEMIREGRCIWTERAAWVKREHKIPQMWRWEGEYAGTRAGMCGEHAVRGPGWLQGSAKAVAGPTVWRVAVVEMVRWVRGSHGVRQSFRWWWRWRGIMVVGVV